MASRRALLGALLALATAAAAPACVVVEGRASASGRRRGRQRPTLDFEAYRRLDGLGLAELVRSGKTHPRELLALAYQRAREVNPKLNAVSEDLRGRALAEIAAGLPDGPFRGVPFLLKDLATHWQGTVTTGGSRLTESVPSDFTSVLVERHRAAGLVIFGKTTAPEFGATATTESQRFGLTRNPWNLEYTSGGSSGGSAALVAAGVTPLAHATDGGGSIRIPASCCGLFGLKPTRARVPIGPSRLEGLSGLSVAHAVTRSVRDSAALLDATRGLEPGSPYAAPPEPRSYLDGMRERPGRLRIAVVRDSIMRVPTHDDCLVALEETVNLCESLGHEVRDAQLPVVPVKALFEGASAVFSGNLQFTVERAAARRGRAATRADLERVTWHNLEQAKRYSARDVVAARQRFYETGRAMAIFQRDFDVVLSPTLAAPPVRLGEWSLDQDPDDFVRKVPVASAFTMLYNITGQPAMSVPLHWNADGLPVGTMFAGRFGDEMTLFRLAAQIERARPWFDRAPAL